MQILSVRGLLKIELPEHTVRLCDAGFIVWDGETYRGKDALFGTIGSVEVLAEGKGDEIPALEMELMPPKTAAIADLSKPGYQRSRVRFWIAEWDRASGAISGTPELMYDGQIDQTSLKIGKERKLTMTVVSNAERLFELNIGNTLNPGFHKSVWPGEKGHDNATGLTVPVAWGVASPGYAGGGSGFGGGGFGGENGFGQFPYPRLNRH